MTPYSHHNHELSRVSLSERQSERRQIQQARQLQAAARRAEQANGRHTRSAPGTLPVRWVRHLFASISSPLRSGSRMRPDPR